MRSVVRLGGAVPPESPIRFGSQGAASPLAFAICGLFCGLGLEFVAQGSKVPSEPNDRKEHEMDGVTKWREEHENYLRDLAKPVRVIFKGACNECGDEWTERTPPAICPECHSLNVRTVQP